MPDEHCQCAALVGHLTLAFVSFVLPDVPLILVPAGYQGA